MGFVSRWGFLFSLVCVLSASVRADAPIPYEVVPGQMGPLALPIGPTIDPVVGQDVYIELAWINHFSNDGDYSGAPYFKILVPFHQVVALEFDGTPLEMWEISQKTQDKWQNPDKKGVSKGDIRFGVRAHLIQEREVLPSIGVRFLVKTTTGKDEENRRFINAPAYLIQALLGKDIWKNEGFIRKIRVLARMGFMAWQQGHGKQNDVIDFGVATQISLEYGLRLDVDLRGYVGFQGGDKPVEIAVTLNYLGKFLDFYVGGAMGITSEAPDWELVTGMALHFPTPEAPWIDRNQ